MSDSPGKRLKLFREMLSISQRDFAAKVSVSGGTIGQIESDIRPPSRSFLERVSVTYQLNADWLLYGRGEMRHAAQAGFQPSNPQTGHIEPPDRGKPMAGDLKSGGEEFSFVRRYDVSASAGTGIAADAEGVIERIAFQTSWLRQRGVAADMAGLIGANGVSMEPLIPDGALMLVKFNIMTPYDDGIYIFRTDGEVFVKHLTIVEKDPLDRPEKLLVSSQNSVNPPYLIALEDGADFRLIAKVITVIADI